MRIACVYFPHLYMQIEKLTQPQLEGYPVIIGGMPEERSSVADCSEEAAAQGVFAGMSLRQAYHLCPEALFLPFGGRCEHIWEDILFALGVFTLRVEPTIPGLACLDITEALKIYGNERAMASAIIQDMLTSLRVQVRVGMGNSRFIAKQAALNAWNVLIVRPGEEKTFLSLLSSRDASTAGQRERTFAPARPFHIEEGRRPFPKGPHLPVRVNGKRSF